MLRKSVYILDIKAGSKPCEIFCSKSCVKVSVAFEISLSGVGSELSHTLLIEKVNQRLSFEW